MINKKIVLASAAAAVLAFSVSAQSSWWPFSSDDEKASEIEATVLSWDDLIPSDFVQPENPFATMTEDQIDKLMDGSEESNAEIARLEAEFNYAPVVDDLDGKFVKIPAYITPLEFDNPITVKEFLLVPYVGACMHTPPPPANQIVHTLSEEPVDYPGMYEAVWAIGRIKTETVKSSLASSGYKLELEKIIPYTAE